MAEVEIGIGKTARRAYPPRTTSPSSPAAAPATPKTSTSPARSTPTGSRSRCSPRRPTASRRRPPPSSWAASARRACCTSRGCGPATTTPSRSSTRSPACPTAKATPRLQEIYAEPVKPELIGARIAEIKDAGVTCAVAVTPHRTLELADAVLRGRARPARHPGRHRVGRARGPHGRAAQPQGVHPPLRDPGPRGRLHVVPDGPAPHAHRRGRGAGRGRVPAPRASPARCSASASRWPPRWPTPGRPACATSTRPASTATSSPTAASPPAATSPGRWRAVPTP